MVNKKKTTTKPQQRESFQRKNTNKLSNINNML